MERVSDDELTMLIEKWSDPVQALEEGLLELPALTELRERRAAEKEKYEHFCHICGVSIQYCKCAR